MTDEQTNDSPVKRFRIGFVSVGIWKNDGVNNPFYTVKLQRAYKDGDTTKYTDGLGHGDLLNAAKALERAEVWIASQ